MNGLHGLLNWKNVVLAEEPRLAVELQRVEKRESRELVRLRQALCFRPRFTHLGEFRIRIAPS
jgi:hypothetical protein